jgi:DNA polymerase-3 subunit chi
MDVDPENQGECEVDFYLLGDKSHSAEHLACRLAMMAWERNQKVYICVASDTAIESLDQLMWQYPEGRFLPHTPANHSDASKAPIKVGTLSSLEPTEVVINLCLEAIQQPAQFSRILEIVPYDDNEREACRVKYRNYRNLGLNPQTHEMNK